MNIRRTIFWLMTVGLVWVARGVWDYTPELRERLTRSPIQSVIFIALLLVVIALFAWLFTEEASRGKVLLALLLGGAVTFWGKDLLSGIAWGQIGALFGILVAMVALWFITTWDYIIEPGTAQSMWTRLAPRTPTPQAPPAATSVPTQTASQPAVVTEGGSASVFETPPPPPPPPPVPPATQAR